MSKNPTNGKVGNRPAYTNAEVQELIETYGRFVTTQTALTIVPMSERSLERAVQRGEITRYHPGGTRRHMYKTAEVAALLKVVVP